MVLKISTLCALVLFLSISGVAAISEPPQLPTICKTANYQCRSAKHGIVLMKAGGDLDASEAYASVIDRAAARYIRFFGIVPTPAVIVEGGQIDQTLEDALKAGGFHAVLPWLSAADKRKLARSALRAQIKAQKPDMPEGMLEALVEQALAKVKEAQSDKATESETTDSESTESETSDSESNETGALAHELAHLWFIHHYWAERTTGKSDKTFRYGSPGPDWLDETAAVLAENTLLTSGRHEQITAALTDGTNTGFWPLAQFFTMEHPLQAFARAQFEAAQKAAAVGDKTTKRIAVFVDDVDLEKDYQSQKIAPINFYAQVRAFSDFMIDVSANERIFTHIAGHIAAGGTLEEWLEAHGHEHGLPATLSALEEHWTIWLKDKYF